MGFPMGFPIAMRGTVRDFPSASPSSKFSAVSPLGLHHQLVAKPGKFPKKTQEMELQMENHRKIIGKLWFYGILWDLPSGKRSHNYGKIMFHG